MTELTVSVVAVDRNVWSGPAKALVAKTPEGEIGILAGHEPVLSLLVNGVVRITAVDGSKVYVAVHGGFLAVDNNNVRVLAEVAELAGDIDVSRAQRALENASASGVDSAERLAAIHRAETRIQAATAATAVTLHN